MPEKENTAAVLWTKHCETEMEKRMLGLSKAMDSLSCMVQGLSERFRRPSPEKLTENSLAIWEAYCKDCPNENSCKGISELETEKISAKLAGNDFLGEMKSQNGAIYVVDTHSDLSRCASGAKRIDNTAQNLLGHPASVVGNGHGEGLCRLLQSDRDQRCLRLHGVLGDVQNVE